MNLKLRLQNKAILMAILITSIVLIYTILGLFDITPGVSEDELKNAVSIFVELLVLLGVVVDPTTKGIKDSEQALEYKEPR